MSIELSKLPPRFITFYSFKGGVGRSMALINTAAILAARGFRVLVIDFDLEAPGLSYLARVASGQQGAAFANDMPPGLVDLLADAKERGLAADLFALSMLEVAQIYTRPYPLEHAVEGGALHIMPAGKLDQGYTQRFDELNLRELYAEGVGEPLLRIFKEKFVESRIYDYVLVDSRTGFSDEAGICTRDLADYLMILSGLNKQNIEGTAEFLKELHAASEGKAKFQLILSPVPSWQEELLAEREKVAQQHFNNAWQGELDLSLQIPYHPRLALSEEPQVFANKRSALLDAYRAIEKAMLIGLGHDAESFRREIKAKLDAKEYRIAQQTLEHAQRFEGADQVFASIARLFLPSRLVFDRVEAGSLTIEKILTDDDGHALLTFLVEHLACENEAAEAESFAYRLMDKDKELAGKLFQRIVEANPKSAESLGRYAVFLETQLGDMDGGQKYYDLALEADSKNARILGRYADFLADQRGDMDRAQKYYLLALEVEPADADILGNYASFLEDQCGDMNSAQQYYQRALAVAPEDAYILGNYARFLEYRRGDMDGAQEYYLKALAVEPEDAYILGNYAIFLHAQRNNTADAQVYYQRALAVEQKDVDVLCNYGQILVGQGNLAEAGQSLLSAITHSDANKIVNLAEVCFSLWLAASMQSQDATRWLQGYKFYLQQNFKRHPWNFDAMLAQAAKILPPDELAFAQALAAAFLDADKVGLLDQFPQWHTVEAKPVK